MNKIALGLLCFFVCCTSSREDDSWMGSDGRIKVLSTTEIVADLVREVGGERVDQTVLIRGALDPHSYELVKGDDEKLAHADFIFYSGLGLEHGPSLARYLQESDQALAIGNVIAAEHPESLLFVDGQIDPHIWMDVSLWSSGIDGVVLALSRLDPDHADEFMARGNALRERLSRLDVELRVESTALHEERRYLVTSHDAFNYFSRRYLATDEEQVAGTWRKRCCAPEGLAPEGQLSTTDIQNVIDHLVAHNVSVIFPESNLSRDAIHKIVTSGKKKGMDVHIAYGPLYGDAMGEPGSEGDTYEGMMSYNVRIIVEGLTNDQSSN